MVVVVVVVREVRLTDQRSLALSPDPAGIGNLPTNIIFSDFSLVPSHNLRMSGITSKGWHLATQVLHALLGYLTFQLSFFRRYSPIFHYPARLAWPLVHRGSIRYLVPSLKEKNCISLECLTESGHMFLRRMNCEVPSYQLENKQWAFCARCQKLHLRGDSSR